jgi:hypothetical protein
MARRASCDIVGKKCPGLHKIGWELKHCCQLPTCREVHKLSSPVFWPLSSSADLSSKVLPTRPEPFFAFLAENTGTLEIFRKSMNWGFNILILAGRRAFRIFQAHVICHPDQWVLVVTSTTAVVWLLWLACLWFSDMSQPQDVYMSVCQCESISYCK